MPVVGTASCSHLYPLGSLNPPPTIPPTQSFTSPHPHPHPCPDPQITAHPQGLLHIDLKPSQMVVSMDHANKQAYVRQVDMGSLTFRDDPEQVVFTAAHAPPEVSSVLWTGGASCDRTGAAEEGNAVCQSINILHTDTACCCLVLNPGMPP